MDHTFFTKLYISGIGAVSFELFGALILQLFGLFIIPIYLKLDVSFKLNWNH